MFREIRSLRQEPGPGRRRWFEGDGLELVVWLGADDALAGCQLLYDRGDGPRAVTWRPAGGWSAATVDAGDDSPLRNESPVLRPGGAVPWEWLAPRWKAEAGGLEPALRAAVGALLPARPGQADSPAAPAARSPRRSQR